MDVTATHQFDHSAETLFNYFFDINKIEDKNQRLGSQNIEIECCELVGNEGKIRFSHDVSATGEVPSSLKSFQKEKNRVTQTEHWVIQEDGSYTCQYDVEIKGVPATLKGKMHLVPQGQSATNNVSLNIKCKVPLLGRTIAKFLASDAAHQMEASYQTIKEQLTAS
ncbi:DUF2505 domain-containing protein [Alkalimarinus alittae]|uniref:DUF2505 domain-containing protein n=1 Tax=Alkalimarinus alittae TaxID=2961619 RepID=A0ABY6N6F2_9ALTE|nr:DUF2505 domain-containing protein [Alkalimarinus alittae]UZE97664.1 DUF2505 domain-containing protein [Alkalimarinus alittae]